MAEWCGVSDPIIVAGFEKLNNAAMEEVEVRHIRVRACFCSLYVPRPEDVLIAVAIATWLGIREITHPAAGQMPRMTPVRPTP